MSASRQPTNVPASVRARLQNLARQRQVEFQLLLSEFAIERLLYRNLNARQKGRFASQVQKALPADLPPHCRREIRQGDFLLTGANTPEMVGDGYVGEEAA